MILTFSTDVWQGVLANVTVPAHDPEATLTYLLSAFTYHIRVMANNSIGYSPTSEVVIATTLEEGKIYEFLKFYFWQFFWCRCSSSTSSLSAAFWLKRFLSLLSFRPSCLFSVHRRKLQTEKVKMTYCNTCRIFYRTHSLPTTQYTQSTRHSASRQRIHMSTQWT